MLRDCHRNPKVCVPQKSNYFPRNESDDNIRARSRYSCPTSDARRRFLIMNIFKSDSAKGCTRRLSLRPIGVAAGLFLALLMSLTPGAGRWVSLQVTSSQGAQGNDDLYDSEFRKGLDLLRRHRWEDSLKSFKRANEMRNKQSAECFYGMAQAYQGLEAYKNVAESCDK